MSSGNRKPVVFLAVPSLSFFGEEGERLRQALVTAYSLERMGMEPLILSPRRGQVSRVQRLPFRFIEVDWPRFPFPIRLKSSQRSFENKFFDLCQLYRPIAVHVWGAEVASAVSQAVRRNYSVPLLASITNLAEGVPNFFQRFCGLVYSSEKRELDPISSREIRWGILKKQAPQKLEPPLFDADRILVPSLEVENWVLEHGSVNPGILRRLRPVIDEQGYQLENIGRDRLSFLKTKLRLKNEALILCYPYDQAGALAFFQALKGLKDQQWQAVVVVPPHLEKDMNRLLKSREFKHLRVGRHLYITKEEKEGEEESLDRAALLALARVCVLPGYTNMSYEPLVAQARVAGVPCLAYTKSVAGQTIDHGYTGWTVRAGDKFEMQGALRRVLSLSEDAQETVRAYCRSVSEKEDYLNVYTDRLSALYAELFDQPF